MKTAYGYRGFLGLCEERRYGRTQLTSNTTAGTTTVLNVKDGNLTQANEKIFVSSVAGSEILTVSAVTASTITVTAATTLSHKTEESIVVPINIEFYPHLLSDSVNRTDSRSRSEALTALRTVRPSITGNTTVSGGWEFEAVPDWVGWLLKWTLVNASKGMTSTKVGTTTVYDHVINESNLDQVGEIPSFRAVVGTGEFEKLNFGIKVNTLTISAGVNEILKMSLDVIAQDQQRLSFDTHANPALSALDPYHWKQGSLKGKFYKGTVPINYGDAANWEEKVIGQVNSFELTITNNLVGEKWYLGSGRVIDKLPLLRRDVTASFEIDFNPPELSPYEIYKYYCDGHPIRNLILLFRGPEIVSAPGYYYELEFNIAQFGLEEAPPEVSGPEILTQSISGIVEPANSSPVATPEISVRVRNTKTSYAI